MGVMCRTCLLLRADFFAFRFVSDLRRRQPIATIQEFFSDGSSETKWPLGSKRNALPKRAGNRRRGRAGICAIPAVKKMSGGPAWPAAKKPSRDVARSGPARGIPAPVLRIRSGRSRRRSGCPVLPVPSCSPGATPLLPGQERVPTARAGGIARPRVSSGQMSGCRWLMTGLTCAGPVRPVTPPARQGRERHHGQPCPARRPDRCPEPCVSGQEDRRPVQSAVLCRDGPPGGKRGAV